MSLQSLRIRNFKAVVDSKTVKLRPLTAFIGNNGASIRRIYDSEHRKTTSWTCTKRGGLRVAPVLATQMPKATKDG